MKLTDILAEHEIKVDLEAEDKKEAIEELVDLLISEHELSLRNRDEILDVVLKRESSISTGVGGGVALPHGTVDCINDIIAAMGISSRGIDFDSFDGDPVHIVLLLLVPKNRFGKHIKTLANIARLMNDGSVRESILKAENPDTVFRIIGDAEQGHED